MFLMLIRYGLYLISPLYSGRVLSWLLDKTLFYQSVELYGYVFGFSAMSDLRPSLAYNTNLNMYIDNSTLRYVTHMKYLRRYIFIDLNGIGRPWDLCCQYV